MRATFSPMILIVISCAVAAAAAPTTEAPKHQAALEFLDAHPKWW